MEFINFKLELCPSVCWPLFLLLLPPLLLPLLFLLHWPAAAACFKTGAPLSQPLTINYAQ